MTNRSTEDGKARPGLARGFGKAGGRPLVLAIETGGRACSVAVFAGQKDLLAQEHEVTDHGHATMLMPMIERVMAAAGCAYADLDRIGVAVGPGSFTGLRVGLAAALGLSLATGVPVVGVSSFQVVAAGFDDPKERQDSRLFAVLDSRRDEPFLAELDDRLGFVRPPEVISIEALDARMKTVDRAVLCGDAPAAARYRLQAGIRLAQTFPNASMVALLAADPARRFDLPPKPVYLRPPDVTMPKTTVPTSS